MSRVLMKGNEAIVHGAILAGCRVYFGYPITPASEIAETAAAYMPRVGGTFLQAESEIAAINMVYGAASAGARVMTASSGPGISLKMEGLSYIAGAELPCVVISVDRGGPGLGNIAPEQADYHQVVWGGGHGNYRNVVLAPNSVQEMGLLTMLAFELADRYRTPAYVLSDGVIGQMMEAVELPEPVTALPDKSAWAVRGTADSKHLINSIYLDPDELEAWNGHLQEKYREMALREVRYEEYRMEDAEIAAVGYGCVSRVLRSMVDQARARGIRVGLFRPITLFPFPKERIAGFASRGVRHVLTVELSNGQLVDDVNLALCGAGLHSDFYGRMGGNVPSEMEILKKVSELYGV